MGAPEVSPWLFLFNLLCLLLSFFCISRGQIRRLACIFSLIGLLICGWVLVNISPTQMQMTQAMKQALGADYLEKIPVRLSANMQTHPFNLVDSFRGIALGKTRHQKDIIFATPGGVPLKMEVYQPPEVGKYPAVIVIYGGA
ncbi:MAG: alpha/beta hydrolase, partial [Nostoc sp. DedSLP01]